MHNVASRPLAHEIDAGWIIALWLAIHGGDPLEEIADVGAVAGQIIRSLSNYAFGDTETVSVEDVQSRLGEFNIQVAKGEKPGAQPDLLLKRGPGGTWRFIPNPYGLSLWVYIPGGNTHM